MTSACNDNAALTKKKEDLDYDESETRLQKVKMDKGSKCKATFWENLHTSDSSQRRGGNFIYSNTHDLKWVNTDLF